MLSSSRPSSSCSSTTTRTGAKITPAINKARSQMRQEWLDDSSSMLAFVARVLQCSIRILSKGTRATTGGIVVEGVDTPEQTNQLQRMGVVRDTSNEQPDTTPTNKPESLLSWMVRNKLNKFSGEALSDLKNLLYVIRINV